MVSTEARKDSQPSEASGRSFFSSKLTALTGGPRRERGRQIDYKWNVWRQSDRHQIDRAKWRNTLTYRIHPRFTAGIDTTL